MSKRDAIQTAINRASLMHQVSEDVAKALKAAEIHPALAAVLMTMHHQQQQLDKDLADLRKAMLSIANTLNTSVDNAVTISMALEQLTKRVGVDMSSLFQPDTTVVSDEGV